PDFFSIGGYDGMHAIYEALKKTGGNTDGDALIAAAKGLKWQSPRGPMSIDPDTRDVVQTIYIKRGQKGRGELVNLPFRKIENVKDPTRARGGEGFDPGLRKPLRRRLRAAQARQHGCPLRFERVVGLGRHRGG